MNPDGNAAPAHAVVGERPEETNRLRALMLLNLRQLNLRRAARLLLEREQVSDLRLRVEMLAEIFSLLVPGADDVD